MSVYNEKTFVEFDPGHATGKWDIPTLEPVHVVPERLLGFNYARTSSDYGACIHFFLDDYQFERCWNRPEDNIRVLSKFAACLTPDFSLYRDMPRALMLWNVYRSRLFGQMCQRAGLTVIPTIQYAGPETYDFAFDGIPHLSTVAISSVGIVRDKVAVDLFLRGFIEMHARIQPETVLFYGDSSILQRVISCRKDCRYSFFDSFSQRFQDLETKAKET